MPLPFAPKPDESMVYESLKSTLLSAVTPEQFETLRDLVFAQGTDGTEDEYRRLILLGAASQATSFSGPIPQTNQVVSVSSSDATFDIFDPGINGGVWQIVAAEWVTKAASGSAILHIRDTNLSTSCRISNLSTNDEFPLDEPIYVGYPCKVRVTIGSGSGDNRIAVAVIQVR